MCGIVGIWDFTASCSKDALADIAVRMGASLTHRGPDADGAWADPGAGVALGFRRLAIMDPTPAGNQPMISASGRYIIVFNGEIYNFESMKTELTARGHTFRSVGDTEVLLAAVDAWGLRSTLQRLNGMFAIALWDMHERALHLVRDRAGVKPLYWGIEQKQLMFGSELKALRCVEGWSPQRNLAGERAFKKLGYIPAPMTIYQGIEKLPPGQGVTFRGDSAPERWTWWSLSEQLLASTQADVLDEEEASAQFGALFEDSVRLRTRADVPVGAFLSGGYDSTAVVSALASLGHSDLRTFCIGFDDVEFNEQEHAENVARHFGLPFEVRRMTGADAAEMAPKLVDWYDEPFADSSQFPMAAVSALARDHVGVALSGDGGDELFAGYDRHVWANGTWRTLAKKPYWWRKVAGLAGHIMPGLINTLLSAHDRPSSGAAGIQYMAEMLRTENTDAWYERLVALGERPSARPAGLSVAWFKNAGDVSDDPLVRLRYLDFVQYLSDDILVKLDRASMAFGLEAREPMLDHRLIEFAFNLPPSMLIASGKGKWVLCEYVHQHIPERLMARQKHGFSVPLNDWLRGPLKAFCEDHLLGSSHDECRATDIAARWHAHQMKAANHGPSLWADVVLEAWLRRWRI
tara:strand:+ start:5011 stop:6912 length:1902 start_codon:yes stop_codon:yes gene_type:complete